MPADSPQVAGIRKSGKKNLIKKINKLTVRIVNSHFSDSIISLTNVNFVSISYPVRKNMAGRQEDISKRSIFYARTYRYLSINWLKGILYMLLLVLPVLVIFILNLKRITMTISVLAIRVLDQAYPGLPVSIAEGDFSILSPTAYIKMPNIYPKLPFVLANLAVCLLIIAVLMTGKRKGKPVALYMLLAAFIHTVNCIYFIFATNHFPYSIEQFSDLYIKQQIGIWLTFILLAGIVTAFLGGRGYIYKALGFFAIIAYSLLFGGVRYVVFLYLLYRFSLLYMALMFFVFGPLFDFLYFVSVYSFLVNKLVTVYDSSKGREEWRWA